MLEEENKKKNDTQIDARQLMLQKLDSKNKTIDELTDRWEKTTLLRGITDSYIKRSVALLLENQRLFNDMQDRTEVPDWTAFRRISIPLVRRIFGNELVAWETVGVQPLLGPGGIIYYQWPGKELQDEDIVAKSKKMKANWNYESQYDGHERSSLDAEAELVAILAGEMSADINREIMTDLRNNSGTISTITWTDPEALWHAVHILQGTVMRKIGKSPNWFSCNSRIGKVLRKSARSWEPCFTEEEEAAEEAMYSNVRKVGVLNGEIKLFEDRLFPANFILMGYKGEAPYEAGYFYAPYVPLALTPVTLDPDSFCPRRGFITRYAKKLLKEGSKWYANLKINDFPQEDSKPEEVKQ